MSEKVALITGASRGIGHHLARHFYAQGYQLILVARDAQRLASFAATLDAARVQTLALDLCDHPAVAQRLQLALATHQQLDVLVNAAGIFRPGSTQTPLSDFSALLATNVTAIHHLCQLCTPWLLKSAAGRIFNLASIGGVQPYGSVASYAASKHALVGYSRSIARELGMQGIKVTTLCPDVVDTDMAQGSGFEADEMLSTADICRAVDFVMSLSPAAVVDLLTIGRQPRPRQPA
ncbi:SDR family NAD(P)-dependent oxidoreductase [Erwinia pyrifoliae]|uniref:SDR family oxidoreductase n=1 Tax=Erwinia pyrifoliae TaxID=79967 RepID=A0ABY5X5Y7_ERWPY|nr:SDR family oxidoreductase [Erwinia pyrifoliae]AUX73638.1 NAD(P)-dependent oxidoreductase [Erwinia pyrifoliae]MCA8876054.1 SDR family oxidoreductase [Erwinia pyrifoliae]MCT2387854.1 SDR family oxidoreductase [Erwinia pyrifoliae]MCU8586110.1 SDR family oxidoreductase [Erwinia pyrifoliae]UWS28604.1 SDR family oxidoreductase [Erwinia pyrifoliae]